MRTTWFYLGAFSILVALAAGCQSRAANEPAKTSVVESAPPETAQVPPPPKPTEEKPAAKPPHNPFGLEEIPDPDGPAVAALAARVRLTGDRLDANAEQWVKEATVGISGSIDGQWHERWSGGANGPWNIGRGKTQIKTVGNRVYFLVDSSNGRMLIDTKRDGNQLTGTYRGIDNPRDTGACVFLIVSDERIDGVWAGAGRWDFRRKLKGGMAADENADADRLAQLGVTSGNDAF